MTNRLPTHFHNSLKHLEIINHKTCKTYKTSITIGESLPTGGFPAATQLRSRYTQ